MNNVPPISLWRSAPVTASASTLRALASSKHVFPSGRQALAQALEKARMTRKDRVALPEWSSHCVISACAHIATPIPISEILRHGGTPAAVLIYEQWGWPFIPESYITIRNRFPRAIRLWDRVDSCDWLNRTSIESQHDFEVFSLSKQLGLPGGGLLRGPAGLEDAPSLPLSRLTRHLTGAEHLDSFEYSEYFKIHAEVPHPAVVRWLTSNDISSAIASEATARRRNIATLLASGAASVWPTWMPAAITNGAAPGIVPFLRSAAPPLLETAARLIMDEFGVAATIYNFNWSGDPLSPDYSRSLAIPVHGEIGADHLAAIFARLHPRS